MKKISLLVAVVFMLAAPVMVFAEGLEQNPLRQGRIVGDVSFSYSDDDVTIEESYGDVDIEQTNYNLSFRVGYTVIDNLEVGGFVEWVDGEQDIKNQYFRSANEEETFNYGLAVRYSFLPESQIRPYVGALVGLAEIDLKTDDGKTVHDGYMYGGTIGAYYFFNDNFALEVFYNRTEQDLDDDDSFPHSGDIESSHDYIGLGFVVAY